MIAASVVYGLSTLVSGTCTWLLARAYMRSRSRLLFWSALCFGGFFLNNALLITDVILLPNVDLSVWRMLPALAGIAAMCYGLVVESR